MNAATEMRELEQRAMRIVIYSASCIGAYKLTPFMLWNVQPINEARELTPTIESTWTHHRIRTNVSGHFVCSCSMVMIECGSIEIKAFYGE